MSTPQLHPCLSGKPHTGPGPRCWAIGLRHATVRLFGIGQAVDIVRLLKNSHQARGCTSEFQLSASNREVLELANKEPQK